MRTNPLSNRNATLLSYEIRRGIRIREQAYRDSKLDKPPRMKGISPVRLLCDKSLQSNIAKIDSALISMHGYILLQIEYNHHTCFPRVKDMIKFECPSTDSQEKKSYNWVTVQEMLEIRHSFGTVTSSLSAQVIPGQGPLHASTLSFQRLTLLPGLHQTSFSCSNIAAGAKQFHNSQYSIASRSIILRG